MFDDNQQQQPATDANAPWQPPSTVVAPDPINFGAPTPSTPPATPQPNYSAPEIPAVGTPDLTAPAVTPAPATDDLINLKQQALQQLSPLVNHLDQTPEEKFRTSMMMIQASDDHTLLQSAFEAAQAITDDKARAQALLDVINEINYFTQAKSQA